MTRTHPITWLLLLITAMALATFAPVRAAESYDNCTGFIDSLPTTISTQGTWCLRQDLSTAITSGIAITIASDNVTIDCNDFMLDGLAAGNGTKAYGIYALNHYNATVRHCNVRSFLYGVGLIGAGGGHVVEDSRFDGNTWVGLHVAGDGSVVRRNLILDTGGSAVFTWSAYGIFTQFGVDVLDNTVSVVLSGANASGYNAAYGIYTANNFNGSISSNRLRGLVPSGAAGVAYGIYNVNSGWISLRGNDVSGNASPSPSSIGLRCTTSSSSAKDNIVSGFATGINGCGNDGGNVIKP